jgi:hypothetical protein
MTPGYIQEHVNLCTLFHDVFVAVRSRTLFSRNRLLV